MASPFRAFRKHQKQWLAVLGVLTMFSFVFLPIFLDRITGARAPTNAPVVTTTRYGTLYESDLQQFMHHRRILRNFLEHVAAKIREKGGTAGKAMQMANQIGLVDEESTVTSWLMFQRARELGIVVSDKSVSLFLQSIMRGLAYSQPAKDAKDAQPQFREIRLGNNDLKSILSSLKVGHVQFAEIWRTELMAQMLAQEFMFSLDGIPPGQRWDYFQRFSRRATVEVLPVPVDDFVKEIADPDQDTLKAYFEKHKNQRWSPDSPLPGFRQPHRIMVEYLKADQNKYVDRAAVTDKEIAEYYEQFKDIYYREEPAKPAPETQPGPATPEAKPAEKQPPAAPKAAADTPPAKKAEESKPAQPAKEPEAKKPSAESKPAPEKPAPEKPAADKPPPAKPEQKPAPAEKTAPGADSKKSSSTTPRSLYHFASFQAKDESAAKSSPAAKPAEPTAKPAAPDAAAPNNKPAASDNKPAVAPAKSDSASGKGDASAAKPAEKPADKPAQPEASKPAETKPKEPAPTYIPLEKVKERIRDTLAQRQANAKMQKVLAGIQTGLDDYQQEWLKWKVGETTRTTGESSPPPPRPDFKELAKQHNLMHQEIPPVSVWDIKAYGGISTSNVITGGPEVGGGTPFITYAFETLTEFRPALSQDVAGNAYLFWKTKDIPEHVPSFDDPGIAEEVQKTWKRAQARSKALAKAESFAEEARKAQQTLGRLFGARPGFQVTKTEPFSWLSFGAIPARFAMEQTRMQISDVQSVDQPGDQFMSTVFKLSPGDIGVSPNQPEMVYYVIRAVDFTPSLDELWNSFREGPDMQSISRVASRDQQETMRAWMIELKTSVNLEWKREPYRARGE